MVCVCFQIGLLVDAQATQGLKLSLIRDDGNLMGVILVAICDIQSEEVLVIEGVRQSDFEEGGFPTADIHSQVDGTLILNKIR